MQRSTPPKCTNMLHHSMSKKLYHKNSNKHKPEAVEATPRKHLETETCSREILLGDLISVRMFVFIRIRIRTCWKSRQKASYDEVYLRPISGMEVSLLSDMCLSTNAILGGQRHHHPRRHGKKDSSESP